MSIMMLFWILSSAHADERYVVCEGLLKSPRPAVVAKSFVIRTLDSGLTTWPVYRSTDPATNVIMLVTTEERHHAVAVTLIQDLGVNGLFPGRNVHRAMEAHWLSKDDLRSAGEEFELGEIEMKALNTRLNAPAHVTPGHFDSVTYIEDAGAAFENVWSEPDLRFVHFNSEEQFIVHRDTTLIVGQRATGWATADWVERPLELMARDEDIPGGRGLPRVALDQIAAIYVAAPTGTMATRQ